MDVAMRCSDMKRDFKISLEKRELQIQQTVLNVVKSQELGKAERSCWRG